MKFLISTALFIALLMMMAMPQALGAGFHDQCDKGDENLSKKCLCLKK